MLEGKDCFAHPFRFRVSTILLASISSAKQAVAHTGFAGSRSGALIATAWTSMAHLGQQQYLQLTDAIMKVHLQKAVPGASLLLRKRSFSCPQIALVFRSCSPARGRPRMSWHRIQCDALSQVCPLLDLQ